MKKNIFESSLWMFACYIAYTNASNKLTSHIEDDIIAYKEKIYNSTYFLLFPHNLLKNKATFWYGLPKPLITRPLKLWGDLTIVLSFSNGKSLNYQDIQKILCYLLAGGYTESMVTKKETVGLKTFHVNETLDLSLEAADQRLTVCLFGQLNRRFST